MLITSTTSSAGASDEERERAPAERGRRLEARWRCTAALPRHEGRGHQRQHQAEGRLHDPAHEREAPPRVRTTVCASPSSMPGPAHRSMRWIVAGDLRPGFVVSVPPKATMAVSRGSCRCRRRPSAPGARRRRSDQFVGPRRRTVTSPPNATIVPALSLRVDDHVVRRTGTMPCSRRGRDRRGRHAGPAEREARAAPAPASAKAPRSGSGPAQHAFKAMATPPLTARGSLFDREPHGAPPGPRGSVRSGAADGPDAGAAEASGAAGGAGSRRAPERGRRTPPAALRRRAASAALVDAGGASTAGAAACGGAPNSSSAQRAHTHPQAFSTCRPAKNIEDAAPARRGCRARAAAPAARCRRDQIEVAEPGDRQAKHQPHARRRPSRAA